MLDEAVVRSSGHHWLELDASKAVRHWTNRPARNYGLFVAVTDANNRNLNAASYLRDMNCSFAGKFFEINKVQLFKG